MTPAAAASAPALAAVLVRDDAPELRLVYDWLDSWSGIGLIIAGMTHQGWDVQLTAYAARDWRANFFPVGIAHPSLAVRRGRRLGSVGDLRRQRGQERPRQRAVAAVKGLARVDLA